jgi:hypothetical protein
MKSINRIIAFSILFSLSIVGVWLSIPLLVHRGKINKISDTIHNGKVNQSIIQSFLSQGVPLTSSIVTRTVNSNSSSATSESKTERLSFAAVQTFSPSPSKSFDLKTNHHAIGFHILQIVLGVSVTEWNRSPTTSTVFAATFAAIMEDIVLEDVHIVTIVDVTERGSIESAVIIHLKVYFHSVSADYISVSSKYSLLSKQLVSYAKNGSFNAVMHQHARDFNCTILLKSRSFNSITYPPPILYQFHMRNTVATETKTSYIFKVAQMVYGVTSSQWALSPLSNVIFADSVAQSMRGVDPLDVHIDSVTTVLAPMPTHQVPITRQGRDIFSSSGARRISIDVYFDVNAGSNRSSSCCDNEC